MPATPAPGSPQQPARSLAEVLTERHGLDASRVEVIPNYVVPDDWSPAHVAAEDSTGTRLCFFGRLAIHVLLQIAARQHELGVLREFCSRQILRQ